jgi:hypothetical protein
MSRKLLSIRTETLSGSYCDSCQFAMPLVRVTQPYDGAIERAVLEAFEKHDCADYRASLWRTDDNKMTVT